MLYISKFQDFNNDFINESMIYYSPDFRERVEKVFNDYNSDIAEQIIDAEATDIKGDYTLIDSKQDSDYITFITNKNANKLLKKAGYDNIDIESSNKELIDKIWNIDKQYKQIGITTQSRNNMKIGKFVKKLFGNKFTDKQIEEFVNQFKSQKESKLEFKLVSGEEISKWYHPSSIKQHKGSLGNSCMNSPDKNCFFKLYTENPEVCQLLILLEDNKLVGRALVWKINKVEGFIWDGDKNIKDKKLNLELSKFEYFMDRVYTTEDYLENNFINLAKKSGWLYKWNNNSNNPEYVELNNECVYVKMSVKVKKLDYSPYPYLDTFKRYNHFNGTLNNDDRRKLGGHILTSTQGDIYYQSISRGRYYINRFKDLI